MEIIAHIKTIYKFYDNYWDLERGKEIFSNASEPTRTHIPSNRWQIRSEAKYSLFSISFLLYLQRKTAVKIRYNIKIKIDQALFRGNGHRMTNSKPLKRKEIFNLTELQQKL